MKRIFLICFSFLFLFETGFSQSDAGLIPEPVKMSRNNGSFVFDKSVGFVAENNSIPAKELEIFSAEVESLTGLRLEKLKTPAKGKNITLRINSKPDAEIGNEGYKMDARPSGIIISANQPAGIFYGMQTLLQLLSMDVVKHGNLQQASIPAVSITDYPRFAWRGLMLDVSRHFFSKEFIKKYLGQMSKYKYNVFHWHLSDDPGWRIEIKQYPKLTEVGAWRVPRTGIFYSMPVPEPGEKTTYGGFYTQEDIKEIVQYAADRFITVVPEIDIPGHSRSLIAAYPQASCSGKQISVYAGEVPGPGENVLCAGNEDNFRMISNILDEIVALFPGNYIHIGGDEVNKDFWHNCPKCHKTMSENGLKDEQELQSYFIKRVEKIVESKGKQLIGWDEILEGGLAPNATVMSWRGIEGGIKAASEGHNVIMAPTDFCYLDYMQGESVIEGFPSPWSKLRLSTAYSFEPVPDGIDPKYILGGQGNVWTEVIETERQAEYMTWPRAMALSEVFWTPKEKRSKEYFFRRMEKNLPLLDKDEVKYSLSVFDPIITPVQEPSGELKLAFSSEVPGLDIYYSFEFGFPDQYSAKYEGKPASIPIGAVEVKAITYRDGKPIGRLLKISIDELKSRL